MQKKQLKSALLSVGLSDHQAIIYLELAKLGPSTSGPLITNTGLHRNVVYTGLRHLTARKYVTETLKKGKKRFSITDPEILSREFAEKAKLAKEISDEISTIAAKPLQEITVYEGNEAYLALLTSLIRELPHGGASYVIGTGGEEFMSATMRPIWRKYHKTVREQGIKIKMISYETHREMLAKDLADQSMYQVKYLPDEVENPSGVRIYPEAGVIVNVIFSTKEQTVTAIRIKNNDLVQGQLILFKNLWKMGKR